MGREQIPMLRAELRLVYACERCGHENYVAQPVLNFLMLDRKLRAPYRCLGCGGRSFILLRDRCYVSEGIGGFVQPPGAPCLHPQRLK